MCACTTASDTPLAACASLVPLLRGMPTSLATPLLLLLASVDLALGDAPNITLGPKKRPKKAPRPPPEILPTCLNGTYPLMRRGRLAPTTDDGLMHVAFYDTRKKANIAGMLRASRLINGSGVRLHALLAHPQAVPGMEVTQLHLPPRAKCIHGNLCRLSHGPGPQYLYKPLLHWVLPVSVRRLIVLDSDVVLVRPLRELWAEFERFDGALVGVANEQSNLYRRSAVGKNGGVQLLDLAAMRASAAYADALDWYAAGHDRRWIGYLGDQTLYSFLAASHPAMLYQLPCEWNRQLSMQFGFGNATVHTCPRKCGLLHANYGVLKCVAMHMQLDPSCDNWRKIYQGDKRYAKCPGSYRGKFMKAAARFFSDCCRDPGGAAAA